MMRRIEVIEGPLRGEPPKKIVDALVVDEEWLDRFEVMRAALECIRALGDSGESTASNAVAIAEAALKFQPRTFYEWDALRNANGA